MNNGFDIDKIEIDNIFKTYQQRKTNEEIEYINSTHKGLQGLAKKLKTDLDSGISNNSFFLRLAPSTVSTFIVVLVGTTYVVYRIVDYAFNYEKVGEFTSSENEKKSDKR